MDGHCCSLKKLQSLAWKLPLMLLYIISLIEYVKESAKKKKKE
jgi:hypothetical protein